MGEWGRGDSRPLLLTLLPENERPKSVGVPPFWLLLRLWLALVLSEALLATERSTLRGRTRPSKLARLLRIGMAS